MFQLKFLSCKTQFLILKILIEQPENQNNSEHIIIIIKTVNDMLVTNILNDIVASMIYCNIYH